MFRYPVQRIKISVSSMHALYIGTDITLDPIDKLKIEGDLDDLMCNGLMVGKLILKDDIKRFECNECYIGSLVMNGNTEEIGCVDSKLCSITKNFDIRL